MMSFKNILIIGILATALLAVSVFSQPDIHWKVIAAGGAKSSSGGLQLDATIGQTAATLSSGGTRSLQAGYWQNFECCIGIRGDIDGNGADNDVFDMTYLIDAMFRGGPAPPCPTEADLDGDGNPATVLDLTFIIDDVFRGGPAPGGC